jgi:alpha-galactosidase
LWEHYEEEQMVAYGTSTKFEFNWHDEALGLSIATDAEGVPRLSYLLPRGATGAWSGKEEDGPLAGPVPLGLQLLDVVVAGSGKSWAGRRYCDSVVGGRMRYAGHSEQDDGKWHELEVALHDAATGLEASVFYRILSGTGALQSHVKLINRGPSRVVIESVSSFLGGGLAGPGGAFEDVEILWAENDWLAEGRWQSRRLCDALPDLNRARHHARSRTRFGLTSVGTWSSGTYLPMGALVNKKTGYTLLWQIEHNGGWHWQVGEHHGTGTVSSYLALLGPTDAEHHWRLDLEPGETFETVPVGVALSGEGFEGAVARMTRYRREIRRPHEDHRRLPVIFNDYMNTLMGDPTTERLLPLVSAAARAGAEYFCIDAGWYAEVGSGWWDTVGAWVPSRSRFPHGISEVLDHIRAEGMVPGLWVEPEVVGTRSPVAELLPPAAFFTRGGTRVVDSGRYQLDLCHPEARAHLDKVVDFLVGDLGVGYMKMDYNINVAPGTEPHGIAPGVGMLAHNRAVLDWLDAVLDRHPALTIESCSSGAMRTDYALLARCQLQSTSDQQDFLRYPPIAAAAHVAIAPEQAAVWAYPQPEWDDDGIAFTLCNAMLGRVHLSGFLDRMTPSQQALVAQGIAVYKQIRPQISAAFPFWPLGLPKWADPWVALGVRGPNSTYVVVWRRQIDEDGTGSKAGPSEVTLPLGDAMGDAPRLDGAAPTVLFPSGGAEVSWQPSGRQLRVSLPRMPSACLVSLTSR